VRPQFDSVFSFPDPVHSEYDPFIVRSLGADSEEFLVLITSRHIIEQNIEGITTEMLELTALESANAAQEVTNP